MPRFWREAEILQRLDHPAIVSIRGMGEVEQGGLYIAMELLTGETLGSWMRRGRLNPSELSPVVTGTAVGLHAAHAADVVHRDLKPDNIFLTYPDGDGRVQVKILDFGISKLQGSDRITRTGQVLGTPRYMAPEQLIADRHLDHRVDIYAMGTILYEALAGTPPFTAKSPSQLVIAILRGDKTALHAYRPDLPVLLTSAVDRAMAPLPDDRFGDALDLANVWVDAVRGMLPPRTRDTEGGDR